MQYMIAYWRENVVRLSVSVCPSVCRCALIVTRRHILQQRCL